MNTRSPTGSPSRDSSSADTEGFGPLTELALDMRWSWNHATDNVWRQLDADLWETTHNPWVVLQTASRDQIQKLLGDPLFRKEVDGLVQKRRQAAEARSWFRQNHVAESSDVRRLFQHGIHVERSVTDLLGRVG